MSLMHDPYDDAGNHVVTGYPAPDVAALIADLRQIAAAPSQYPAHAIRGVMSDAADMLAHGNHVVTGRVVFDEVDVVDPDYWHRPAPCSTCMDGIYPCSVHPCTEQVPTL